MSDFNVEKIWEPGLNCSVKSKTLKKVVRAQVIGTDGEEKLNVVLVDYGIRESCYMISLAFLTWEQGQLPACGFEGTLKISNVFHIHNIFILILVSDIRHIHYLNIDICAFI